MSLADQKIGDLKNITGFNAYMVEKSIREWLRC